jgi:hypothetical protein
MTATDFIPRVPKHPRASGRLGGARYGLTHASLPLNGLTHASLPLRCMNPASTGRPFFA